MSEWDDAEQRVERARQLFAQRQWERALQHLRAAVAADPSNGSWLFNIGLTLDAMNRLEEAVAAYRRCLELNGDDIEALCHLGADLHRLGRLGEALAAFQRIEDLDASYEPAYCHRILILSDAGQHEQAEEMFYTARMYKEECPACYCNVAVSLLARGLYDKALYCLQRTLDLDDDYPQVHLRMAQALRRKGERAKARQHYLSELRRNPGDTRTLLELGDLLLDMGHVDDAGEKFRRAIELAPHSAAAYFSHGRWLLCMDRPAEALWAFSKTLQLDPAYPGAHLRLAHIYLARGHKDMARRHLRNEHLLAPQDPRLALELGNLLLDIDDPRVAVACLKRLTQLDPHNASAWQNLAVACFTAKQWEDGLAASRHALRLHPHRRALLHNLAIACQQHGDYAQAEHWIKAGLELDGRDAAFHHLRSRLRLLKAKARVMGLARRIVAMPQSFLT